MNKKKKINVMNRNKKINIMNINKKINKGEKYDKRNS